MRRATGWAVALALSACSGGGGSKAQVALRQSALCAAPVFAGLSVAQNQAAAVCGVALSWAPAASGCALDGGAAGTITYAVYRGRSPDFTPSERNRLATGLTGTAYIDTAGLRFGVREYYVVRAAEAVGADVVEDGNAVSLGVVPSGPLAPGLSFFDDFDGSRPPNASAYWSPATASGASNVSHETTGCRYQSAMRALRLGQSTASCGGRYADATVAAHVFGGDGTVESGVDGFAIPATTVGAELSFATWFDLEDGHDGVTLEYSTSGAAGPWQDVSEVASATVPFFTRNGYTGQVAGARAFTGARTFPNGALPFTTVSLDPLAGRRVWFRFRLASDASVGAEGFSWDDVRLTAPAAQQCATQPRPAAPLDRLVLTLDDRVDVGVPATVRVEAVDAFGDVVNSSLPIVLSTTDTRATLPPTLMLVDGGSSLTGVFRTAGLQSITVVVAEDAGGFVPSETVTTQVTPGPLSSLAVIVGPPQVVAAGAAFAVTLATTDAFGNPVPTQQPVAFRLALADPQGATLTGTVTATIPEGGVLALSDLSLRRSGMYALRPISALPGLVSEAFRVTALPAVSRLAIVSSPSTLEAGEPGTVVVGCFDAFDNPASSERSVQLWAEPTSGDTVDAGPQVARTDGGLAYFTVRFDEPGHYRPIMLAEGVSYGVVGAPITVGPARTTALVLLAAPSSGEAGQRLGHFVVGARDALGHDVAPPETSVSIAGPDGGALVGAARSIRIGRSVVFDDLSVTRPGRYTFTFSADGGVLAAASAVLPIGEGPVLQLRFATEPRKGDVGLPFPVAPQVQLLDGAGNVVPASDEVELTLWAPPPGTVLSGVTRVRALNGTATFPGLSVNRGAAGLVLRAATGAGNDAIGRLSTPFDVRAPDAGSSDADVQSETTDGGVDAGAGEVADGGAPSAPADAGLSPAPDRLVYCGCGSAPLGCLWVGLVALRLRARRRR